jgi:glyoxylate reductase
MERASSSQRFAATIAGTAYRTDINLSEESMPSILVTRSLPSSVIAKLQEAGTVELYTDGAMPADLLKQRAADKDAIVTMFTDDVNQSLLDAATNLKVVSNVAVGYNNIDVKYARSRGIVVTNTPEVLTESVADFTWAMILSATRRLAEGDRLIRRNGWKGWALDFMLGTELKGKQLGLVGFGRIARAVAARAPVFGMRVAYSDVMEVEGPYEKMSLDRLLNTSDVVSLHVPLTPETRHLIDKKALARMKRSAYLVNTARGPVVEEAALAWALQERLIAGAALDVYENEPSVHPDLLPLENVLLVPHLGSATTETRTAMANLAADNVIAVLAGRAPLTPVVE